jgi:hypothetical protein
VVEVLVYDGLMTEVTCALLAATALAVSWPAYAQQRCWAQRPTEAPLRHPHRHFPEGSVTLECTINDDRSLACRVEEEDPAGWDFGNYALRLSRGLRTCEGVTYDEPLSLTIFFRNDEAVKPDPSP